MVFENNRKSLKFNIASEASYVYILSGQNFIKNAKMVNLTSFWKSQACGQTVFPDRTKIGGKCQNWLIQMRLLEWFSNIVC